MPTLRFLNAFTIFITLLFVSDYTLAAETKAGHRQSSPEVDLIGVFTTEYICKPIQPTPNCPCLNGMSPNYWIVDRHGRRRQILLDVERMTSLGGPEALNGKWVRFFGYSAEPARFGPVHSGVVMPLVMTGLTVIRPEQVDGPYAVPEIRVAVPQGAIPLNTLRPERNTSLGPENRPYLNLLVRFFDTQSITPHPKQWYSDIMRTTSPGLDHYYQELSYGKITLTGSQTMDWLNLPNPASSYYMANPFGKIVWDSTKIIHDALARLPASVDISKIWGIHVFPNIADSQSSNYASNYALTTNGVTRYIPITVDDPGFVQGVFGHETGHDMGFDHSSGPFATPYDSHWDVMSQGYNWQWPDQTFGAVGVHTNAYHKAKVGWIDRSRIYYAFPGTEKQVRLERLALPTNNTDYLMAKIYIAGMATQYYTVEARRYAGYDAVGGIPGEAVVIHSVNQLRKVDDGYNAAGPHFDRAAEVVGGNTSPNDAGAMWTPGRTFADKPNGIWVRVDSMDKTGFFVTIHVDANQPMPGTAYSTLDFGPGSIREALYFANEWPGTHIQFNLPQNDPNLINGVYHIKLSSPLPNITNDSTRIDASPLLLPSGEPGIFLDGSDAGQWAHGLTLDAAHCLIKGLAFGNFTGSGIWLDGPPAHDNTIQGCVMGIDPSVQSLAPNTNDGITVWAGAANNHIGGSTTAQRCVLSGNGSRGVAIWGKGSDGNTITGCYIGVNIAGTAAVPNHIGGISVGSGAKNTLIGGAAATLGNVLSGNQNSGIAITDPGTNGTQIQGNFIGTDASGRTAIANSGDAIYIGNGAKNTLIGGAKTGQGNLLSGNTYCGVYMRDAGTSNNSVYDNLIGTDITGKTALPNNSAGIGIGVGATNNSIGGGSGQGNTISGNKGSGVVIEDAASTGNVVKGNRIGLDVTGSIAIGNLYCAVYIHNANGNTVGGVNHGEGNICSGNSSGIALDAASGNLVVGNTVGLDQAGSAAVRNNGTGISLGNGAAHNRIGLPGSGNIVSGNDTGIYVDGAGTDENVFLANLVGVDATGTHGVGNLYTGVWIGEQASRNQVGGVGTGDGNIISGNGGNGVDLYKTSTSGNLIVGNRIGVTANGSALGNTYSGVYIEGGASNNVIGGTGITQGNVIANNGSGVVVVDTSVGNTIRGNAIFNNAYLGINLQGSGNHLQSAPVLSGVTQGLKGLTGEGKLTSKPAHSYAIDLYALMTRDPSGYGQGDRYLGTLRVTTDAKGVASFTLPGASLPTDTGISATATDLTTGDTSSFSHWLQLPQILSLSMAPSTVTGGESGKGVVTLNVPGDTTTVAISSNSTFATVPASFSILPGRLITSFPITTKKVSSTTKVTITVTLNGNSKTATLTLK